MFEMKVGIALQGNRPREPYSGLNVQMPSAFLFQMCESHLECLGIVVVSVAGGAEIDERYGILRYRRSLYLLHVKRELAIV